MTTNGVYKYECKAGTYESDTLIGLLQHQPCYYLQSYFLLIIHI